MKHLFIVNPIAGGSDKTEEIRAKVVSAFAQRKDEEWEIYVTKAPQDATAKILAEAESGEELRVYACGGDGTFNECASGAVGKANVAVCPHPTGTGNDFCRMFGQIPHAAPAGRRGRLCRGGGDRDVQGHLPSDAHHRRGL